MQTRGRESVFLRMGLSFGGGWTRVPKDAGAASPFGSGELKYPRFPPVAKGPSNRDLVDIVQVLDAPLFPLNAIVL